MKRSVALTIFSAESVQLLICAPILNFAFKLSGLSPIEQREILQVFFTSNCQATLLKDIISDTKYTTRASDTFFECKFEDVLVNVFFLNPKT